MIDKNIYIKIILGVFIAMLLVLPVTSADKISISQATADVIMTDTSIAKIEDDATLNWTYGNMNMLWTPKADIPGAEKSIIEEITEAIFGESETIIEAQSIDNDIVKTPINDKMSVSYEFYADKVKETITLTEQTERIYYTYDISLKDKYIDYVYMLPNATETYMMENGQVLYDFAGDNGQETKTLKIYKASEHTSDIKLLTENDKYVSFNKEIQAKGGLLITIDDQPSVFYEKPYAIDALGKRFEMNFILNKAENTVDIEGDLTGAVYPINIDPTGNIVTIDITTISGKTIIKWIYSATGANTTWTVPSGLTSVDYMVLAGGGGGGTWNGGGGGAGGFLNGTGLLVNSTINVSVGYGGYGGKQGNYDSQSGENSTFGSIIAIGGGSGGSDGNYQARSGGSGGGGGNTGTGGALNVSLGGNKGGDGLQQASGYPGGGGGGANGAGGNAGANNGGTGGVGVYNSLTGTTILLAGGGGGGSGATAGTASFGGGAGGANAYGSHATINTGAGGGGGAGSGSIGGNGSAGMIVIQYTTPVLTQSNFTTNASTYNKGNYIDVQLTDTSIGYVNGWQWLATNVKENNTQVQFATTQNPIFSFLTGNWSVVLNATNGTTNKYSTAQFINISPRVLRETVGNYIVETYTDTNGNYNWSAPSNVLTGAEIVVVAGGGNGGAGAGGGGGAGGMINQTITISPNTGYNIVVANGHSNSTFGSYTAMYGGNGGAALQGAGQSGGSGGGGASPTSGYTASHLYSTAGSAVMGSQGNNGGTGHAYASTSLAAAGGGAGGAAPADAIGNGQTGGIGRITTINGTSITYATGGDGYSSSASGGSNTGNGASGNGGVGGTGIVIVKYELLRQELTANFASNITTQSFYPMVVNFNDTTTNGSATIRNWSMGDGRWINGTSQNITYTYAVAGKYNVALYINNATYSTNITKSQYINLTSDDAPCLNSWLHFNGTNGQTTFNGEKGVAWSSAGGAQITTSEYVFGGASGQFTTNKARIYTGSLSSLNMGSNPVSIEFWVNVTTPATNRPIIGRTAGDLATGWAFYNSGGTGYKFEMGGVSTDAVTIPTSTRTHVVIEKVGSIVYIYINGALATTKTGYAGNYDLVQPIIIGDTENNGNRFYMDEFRYHIGCSLWTSDFTTPYNQYAGTLETIIPDINPLSTFRYKTNPTDVAIISNSTDYGSGYGVRNRTIQIENVYNTSYIVGDALFNPVNGIVKNVYLNTSTYNTGMTLVSSSIDNVNGLVSFNISRTPGFNNGTVRASIIDYQVAYVEYRDPGADVISEYFADGYLINGTTLQAYPIHYFIGTPITYAPWTFVANFTANTTLQHINNPVEFNATFTGSYPNRWNWSWGDGTFTDGTEYNLTHTYSTAGIYTVAVREYMYQNVSVNDTKTRTSYISIYDQIATNFTGTPLIGQTPMIVAFTDHSTGTPTAWDWNFGDGSANFTSINSTIATHTYSTAGIYNVSLITSNAGSSGYMVRDSYILVANTPTSNFTGTPTTGNTPFNVQFTDTSIGTPTAWTWNFGDGTPTNATQNPLHTYTTDGQFTVSLTVSNYGGTDGETKNAYITAITTPEGNFTGTPTVGANPLTVQFTDTSTHTPTSWLWDFGDGTYSNAQNPSHTYATGIYTVSMIATNAAGSSPAKVRVNYITSTTLPFADFSATPTMGITSLNVVFTDQTTNLATSWVWDFGDGNTSALQNPTHTYVAEGVYNVSLTSGNIYGTDTITKPSYIQSVIPAHSIITDNVVVSTDGGQYCAEFNGYNYGSTTTGWFEYGAASPSSLNPSGSKPFKTKNQTITTGNYSTEICGIPLLPGKTYVVSSVGAVGSQLISGSNKTFTMGALVPHATTTYTEFSDKFTEDGGDPIELLTVDPWLVYTGLMGSGLFFGLLIFFIYANVVIKQKGVIITIILMLITGGAVFQFLPAQFLMVAQMLIIAGFAGVVYWIFFRRQ